MAVDHASLRALARVSTGPSIGTRSATILRARRVRAFLRHGEHPATEEARPDRGAPARGESALPLDREDADEAARSCGLRGRHGEGGFRARRARADDRQSRLARRAAQEHGRTEEVARGAARRRRRRLALAEFDQRPLELEVRRQLAAALERVVERRQPDDRATQFLLGEVRRLAEDLLDVERVPLEGGRGVAGADSFGRELLAPPHEREVVPERPGEPRGSVAPRPSFPLEDRLRRLAGATEVALRPGVREGEGRCLRDCSNELFHLMLANRLVTRPERQLVDLVRELVQVVADELDESRHGLRLGPYARLLEALGDPGIDLLLDDVESQ